MALLPPLQCLPLQPLLLFPLATRAWQLCWRSLLGCWQQVALLLLLQQQQNRVQQEPVLQVQLVQQQVPLQCLPEAACACSSRG